MKNNIKLKVDIKAIVEEMLETNDWNIMEFYHMEDELLDIIGRYDVDSINNDEDYCEAIKEAIAYSYRLGLINALRYITKK